MKEVINTLRSSHHTSSQSKTKVVVAILVNLSKSRCGAADATEQEEWYTIHIQER